jgi:hypothetical protein
MDYERFAPLVTPHTGTITCMAAALVGIPDAEDAAQEALMRAWRAWPGLREADSTRAWLMQITVNVCRTWQSAPTRGIPSDHAAYLQMGLLGTLSDGSVVIDVIPPSTTNLNDSWSSSNFEGSDLYAWKPGDSGWRLIGSAPQEIDGLLVKHAPTGDYDTIYAFLTTRNDENTFSILRRNVAS